MKTVFITFVATIILSGCSVSNIPSEEVAEKPSSELEFAVDTIQEDPGTTDLKVKEENIAESKTGDEFINPLAEVHEEEMKIEIPEEPKFASFKKKNQEPSVVEEPKITIAENESSIGEREEKYIVQKSDTLMMIGFKIYGDYRKWKDLKEWNKDKFKGKLSAGMSLKYYLPAKSFGWQPSGLPYLVKTGDSLGMISMDKYGTSKKWKSIYENNRPLIRNPNLIFSGFTIYYVPTRDVASKTR